MLSPRDRAVLNALLPADGNALPGLFETGFDDFASRFEAEAPLQMRLAWRAALWAAAWAAPMLIFRLPPLDRLLPADRTAALEALGKSRWYTLRQLLFLLKTVAAFGYGLDARVQRAVGDK